MFKGQEIVDKWKMVPFIKGISFFKFADLLLSQT